MDFTKEQIAKAKEAKSVEELLAYANEIGFKLTEDEAKLFFRQWHSEGELADEELSNVAGGSICINGRSYSENKEGYLITTVANYCDLYHFMITSNYSVDDGYCNHCGSAEWDWDASIPVLYCHARTRFNDPYNSAIGGK